MLDWIQTHSEVISLASSLLLLVVTGIYVYLTKRILEATKCASRLALNPVIGIEVGEIRIGEVYGKRKRRNMSVDLKLTNVGNAPAIETLVDAEIILAYSAINGEQFIPSRFEPQMISFIKADQAIEDSSPSFGNTLITHLLDDYREQLRLNTHRIETNPTQETFSASQLRIIVSYRNSVGQPYESTYQVHLHLGETKSIEIPKENESVKMIQMNIPRPRFHSGPVQRTETDAGLLARNRLRDLCGWGEEVFQQDESSVLSIARQTLIIRTLNSELRIRQRILESTWPEHGGEYDLLLAIGLVGLTDVGFVYIAGGEL